MKEGKGEIVVLLHGIGHNRWAMAGMEHALKRAGYETLNLTYPSLRHDIHALSAWLAGRLDERGIWRDAARVNFVCHSMGGLVTGFYLESRRNDIPPGKMGRVVMIGTPHGGSEVADALKNFLPYQFLFGPAGQELTTGARGREKIAPWYDLGIIAGVGGWAYPLGLCFIRRAHDGCVAVDSTKLDGMKDHIVLPVQHGLMCWNKKTKEQTVHFLKNAEFSRDLQLH